VSKVIFTDSASKQRLDTSDVMMPFISHIAMTKVLQSVIVFDYFDFYSLLFVPLYYLYYLVLSVTSTLGSYCPQS